MAAETCGRFGLSWNRVQQGLLLSSAEDQVVCLWDCGQATQAQSILQPLSVFKGHTGVVGDVAWHAMHKHLFGSVSDDHHMFMYDALLVSVLSRSRENAFLLPGRHCVCPAIKKQRCLFLMDC